MSLLRKINDAIVRPAGGVHQRGEFGEGVDRDQDGTEGQRGTRHTIGHPRGNGGRLLRVLVEPDMAAIPHTALHLNGVAVQRMPRIVNCDLLSVVGGM